MVLVDTNVLVDVLQGDPHWRDWSAQALQAQIRLHTLVIDSVCYAELSMGYATPALLESALERIEVEVHPTPQAALFLAGRAFLDYRRRGGTKMGVLPDFFIGAHAATRGVNLLTRDPQRYKTYFPSVQLISPHQ